MNLEALQGLYQNDIRLKQIAAGMLMPGHKLRVYLDNLRGSSINFVATALWQLTDANHVFILNDKEEAAYFHNDIEHLTKALDICFFPDSFKRTGAFNELNSSHVMLRTEALTKFAGNKPRKKVLVTYPEALFEKVVNPSSLSTNMIHIKVGEDLKVDDLMAQFVTLGFKREDFVYEPGQFAMRGGILDIYSFGNEHPYRIELFDTEVDSIRIFNPETQLSERKLLQVSILPNIETRFDAKEKISLLDFLPSNTIVWAKDLQFVIGRIEKMIGDLPERMDLGQVAIDHEEEMLKEISRADFETPGEWQEKIKQMHLIEWYNHSIEKITGDAMDATFLFATEEQPVFNRQFNMLIADMQKRIAQKYVVYMFAENPKQLERLRSVFDDLDAKIEFVPVATAISKGFIDHDKKAICYTDHQIFQRYHKYNLKQAYSKGKALTMRALRELQPGDYVTHIDHGVGKYSGLQKIEVNGNMQEAIRILYKDNDVLYVNVNSLHKITKFTGKEGTIPKVNKLGSDAWQKLKNKTKKQVKDIAADLIRLYAKRKASEGFAFSPDSYMQTELEASFFYEDTPDQGKATADVKRDMESASPMDRLVCGDVGFGKTEIAVRAAFKAVADSKQAAILVPTTILAYQHYNTFKERLKDFPCTVDYVNRFKSAKDKKETFKRLEEGKIDILIGTHGILGKDVKFKDLGILIIDEEQKFGVGAKEKLRELKANVDTLTLTATPIPRTLQFSLMNARDLSIINTPPPNRQPVHTEVMTFDEYAIRDALYYETERGGQVYFVHNRVQSLPEMVTLLRGLCPDLSIGMAHGQMEGNHLEEALMKFIEKKFDVLCCTNIVESGVDISNANTMIVNNAHQFGLSDLHQLRGRVGRSNKKAFCYLLAPPMSLLPNDSRKRLQTLEQFNELGSGFQISMRDLDIRGAGNLLGGEQSGFITDIGFEMYQKILAEAMRELKSSDFKEVFKDELNRKKDYVSDCTIDTDLEILIPDTYIENITERLSIYTQLDDIDNDEELEKFGKEMQDRFGPIPSQVNDLFTTIRCRTVACELGFEKLILKNEQMRLYFVSNPESPYFESDTFNHILDYIQTKTRNARLKQVGKNFMLVVDRVKKMKDVLFFLEGMVMKEGKV
ncbi:transcription-repair coupling factor [Flavipsychrobacter stenotrophus]|uniref:Transcription-repair-coupling factor n=1 Tax=Flavipsychrobacter stenotrophus TaxID=2077091 RepID=A0A2S7T0I7_9BACT|nr:transcription-repair coupling factor [Flavipsychrobacter stenotrophus]PQJ12702.1 transcription-repair coupling factor [Flavipsychrobacter stenotrophus]